MGVELRSRSDVGGFHEHLASFQFAKENKLPAPPPSFTLPDAIRLRYEAHEDALRRFQEDEAKRARDLWEKKITVIDPPIDGSDEVQKFFAQGKKDGPRVDEPPPPMATPHVTRLPPGAIVGHLIAHVRHRDPHTKETKETAIIPPGGEIILTTVSGGGKLMPVYDKFVVVDYFKSAMSEYDANCVFISLEHLQSLRGMSNRASSILIKLKNESDGDNVVAALNQLFAGEDVAINTWQEKQGPLLRAIEIEKSILNILLFMIIAVAGFGILAIFSMIVSEKTRDIGILKALGASSGGVMKIFLTYGLLLGVVGAVLGTILGLSITWNINEVEAAIAKITGSKVFDPSTYYFNEIPTDVNATAVLIVNLGAIGIAVVFSIIPALRAAMLHPVQALRYE
jgi:lipoprotein-releasing system permease protein